MKDQHTLIKGYRDLSQHEIDVMNHVKKAGETLGELVDVLRGMDNLDQRWVNIGATDLQTGIMALVRAVAKPSTF